MIGQRDQRSLPGPAELSSEALGPVRARGAEQAEGGAGHPLGLVPGFGAGALRAGAIGYSHCWAVGRKGLF